MIRKLGRKSNKYLFTITLDNEEDLKALSDIKNVLKYTLSIVSLSCPTILMVTCTDMVVQLN